MSDNYVKLPDRNSVFTVAYISVYYEEGWQNHTIRTDKNTATGKTRTKCELSSFCLKKHEIFPLKLDHIQIASEDILLRILDGTV